MTSFNNDGARERKREKLRLRKDETGELQTDNEKRRYIRNNLFVFITLPSETLEQVRRKYVARFGWCLLHVAFVIENKQDGATKKQQSNWTMMRFRWWYSVWNGFISVSTHMVLVCSLLFPFSMINSYNVIIKRQSNGPAMRCQV